MAQSGENMIVVVDASPAAQLALGYLTRLIVDVAAFALCSCMFFHPGRPTC
jgi:hypothetical protein